MDARKMYDTVEIRWEQIQEGDWIRPQSWKRARRVDLVEYRDGKRLLLLAEPGVEELREINLDGFVSRAAPGVSQDSEASVPVWYALPMFKICWDAVQS